MFPVAASLTSLPGGNLVDRLPPGTNLNRNSGPSGQNFDSNYFGPKVEADRGFERGEGPGGGSRGAGVLAVGFAWGAVVAVGLEGKPVPGPVEP